MRSSRLEGVQALRAVAVVLVVLFHAAAAAQVTVPVPEILWMQPLMYFGYGGVNLFFVISGFIMVYITWNHWGDFRGA
jgi:exopolysaccharide production protein ExoZ